MSRKPLETVRAEDFIEYFLFTDLPSTTTTTTTTKPPENNDNDNHQQQYEHFEKLINEIQNIAEKFISNYIWHKDPFNVNIRYGNTNLLDENYDIDDNNETNSTEKSKTVRTATTLPPHIYGITFFDDNIQDEWFIVALLFHLTREIKGLIVRVIDSDGEFMLIEAAEYLPDWANPETCDQRIYIYNGKLHLINKNVNEPISMVDALKELRANSTVHCMSDAVQLCINERIKSYPDNIADGLHRQRVYVPVGVAALLKNRPSLIAAATRAFAYRDQIDMNACRAMKYFPPEHRVTISACFTKYLYAMLTHCQYQPDRRTGWNLPSNASDKFKSHSLGVKLACGFEILAAQAPPRNVATIVGDAEQEDNDAGRINNDGYNKEWLNYLESLKKRGYFQGLLEGSKDFQRLMETAKDFYKNHVSTRTYGSSIGQEIVDLLKSLEFSEDDFLESIDDPAIDDDDSWLNVTPEALDEMLATRYGIKKSISINGNGLSAAACELTGELSDFLVRKSEWDGVEIKEPPTSNGGGATKQIDDGKKMNTKNKTNSTNGKVRFVETTGDTANDSTISDTKIDFNPEAFHAHVKDMLDLCIPEDNWESNSDMSDYDESDDDFDKNMETNTKSLKTYMDQMDKELSATTIGQSFEKRRSGGGGGGKKGAGSANKSPRQRDSGDDFEDIEDFRPVDIDVNALKNLAQSYQSQFGGPGPATSLLGSMGIHIKPEDEPTDIKDTQVKTHHK